MIPGQRWLKKWSLRLERVWEKNVFKAVIPNNIRLAEAPSYGLPVSLHAPDSPGALAYSNLAKEVMAL